MPVEIRGARLLLRRFGEPDVPAMLDRAADPGFGGAVESTGDDVDGIRAYFRRTVGIAPFREGAVFDPAIELHDGAVFGLVSAVHRPRSQAEIGYALHTGHTGHGYAAEAAGMLDDHLFGARAASTGCTSGPGRGTRPRPPWPAGPASATRGRCWRPPTCRTHATTACSSHC